MDGQTLEIHNYNLKRRYMRMKLTNGYILTNTEALVEEILSNEKIKFPAKVN